MKPRSSGQDRRGPGCAGLCPSAPSGSAYLLWGRSGLATRRQLLRAGGGWLDSQRQGKHPCPPVSQSAAESETAAWDKEQTRNLTRRHRKDSESSPRVPAGSLCADARGDLEGLSGQKRGRLDKIRTLNAVLNPMQVHAHGAFDPRS